MYEIPKVTVVTNFYGAVVGDATEPTQGSVVLTEGPEGTAWQRHFKDGLWHRAGGGRPRKWGDLLIRRNLVVVYRAPVREEAR